MKNITARTGIKRGIVFEPVRCRNCRYWSPPHRQVEPGNYGACELGSSDRGRAEYPSSKVVAIDSSVAFAELRTAPDFGCIQFEPAAVHQAAPLPAFIM